MPIYMKIDGIDGKVTEKDHEKWIEVDSIQWGVSRSISSAVGSAKDREASQPSISEVNVIKDMDEASPHIFTEACVGKSKKVQIHLCGTSSNKIQTFMEYELEDGIVSGYSVSASGEQSSESLSLSFNKLTMKFIPHDNTGRALSPIPAGYDMVTGKKV